MPRGGPRINAGPPPDPNALRRSKQAGLDRDGWFTLPSEGYTGPIPTWPLTNPADMDDPAAITEREHVHWITAWRTPQAAAWHRLGWTTDIAIYCRWMAAAELGDLKAGTEARQWSDRLGLNPASMLRNRWRIAPDQVAAQRDTAAATEEARPSARERLKAVNGDTGG